MSLYGFLPGVQSGAGGNGGRVTRAWLSTDTGRPVPGTAYTVVVGNRGAGGAAGAGPGTNVAGNQGANGAAYFSWS
jgi:hypothetical protein